MHFLYMLLPVTLLCCPPLLAQQKHCLQENGLQQRLIAVRQVQKALLQQAAPQLSGPFKAERRRYLGLSLHLQQLLLESYELLLLLKLDYQAQKGWLLKLSRWVTRLLQALTFCCIALGCLCLVQAIRLLWPRQHP